MVKEGEVASKKKSLKKLSANEREEILIENFIGLQKAMVNLSVKFENLSDNISKLLSVFEMSARDYMMNKGRVNPEKDREILSQLNALVDQQRSMSKSISQMEDKMKQKSSEMPTKSSQMSMPSSQSNPVSNSMQGYEPSIQNTQFKPKTI